MSKTIDDNLKLVAGGTAVTATGQSTGVAIAGLGDGDYSFGAEFYISALAGTHDASNNFTLTVEASSDDATYVPVGETFYELATGNRRIGLNTKQVNDAVGGVATHFRVSYAKVGTTATGITFGCYLVKA